MKNKRRRETSPAPRSESMRRDRSLSPVVSFGNGRRSLDKRRRETSPALRSESMRRDRSKNHTHNFRDGRRSLGQRRRKRSRSHSSVSLRGDRSLDRLIDFKKKTKKRPEESSAPNLSSAVLDKRRSFLQHSHFYQHAPAQSRLLTGKGRVHPRQSPAHHSTKHV